MTCATPWPPWTPARACCERTPLNERAALIVREMQASARKLSDQIAGAMQARKGI